MNQTLLQEATVETITGYAVTNEFNDEQSIEIATKMSQLSHRYRQEGHYIQPKKVEDILNAISENRVYALLDIYKNELISACQYFPVYKDSQCEVVELGTLIRVPDIHYPAGKAGALPVRELIRQKNQDNCLVIATSRNKETSGKALASGGMQKVKTWAEVSGIQALTCDPTCRPSNIGEKAWLECDNKINCLACCDRILETRHDLCSLFVSDINLAKNINDNISNKFLDKNGEFSSRILRDSVGLAV